MAAASGGDAAAVEPRPGSGLTAWLQALLPGDGAAPKAARRRRSIGERLFDEPWEFHFNQAVGLLERLYPDRKPVGRGENPQREVVRFRGHLSLSFPPSQIHDLQPPPGPNSPALMTVSFFGLYGPSGALPRFYTEKLIELERGKQKEKGAFRAWLDLFNHHLTSLFFRAWEKYRFPVPYARGEYNRAEPDPFTSALLSYVGLGSPGLRRRLQVAIPSDDSLIEPTVLARIPDVALLPCAGLLAQRPRNALNLGQVLVNYFGFLTRVLQFHGQWLYLDESSQARLGQGDDESLLGNGIVIGSRVWNIQSKLRIVVGPLSYRQFLELLPDRQPSTERKTFFLLSHLVRLYIGADLNFDVQLILRAPDVPGTQLKDDGSLGPRLGWNTWVLSRPAEKDADDAVFDGEPLAWI
ncbi:MAG TPA: type VI secretion system baseplate subunit TssG [Gemmatales bacterium]|nr:type VI secretion system baseplate subunit TssG [Gemmatales bacterium]HMP59772.1 type VI secretion system baseplate subunit TssG [Gemmatales bacterium]